MATTSTTRMGRARARAGEARSLPGANVAQAPRAGRSRRGVRGVRGGRGQSLAEFALTLPMTLLMVLFGLDFGRVFLGWVALNSATREAANYAALNPTAWGATPNLAAQAEYARLVNTETNGMNCTLASINSPTFPNGTGIGSPAVVSLTCQFGLITPLMDALLGSPIPVSASSAFPIRSGEMTGIVYASPTPAATPAPSGSVAPTATPAPTITPPPSSAPSTPPEPTPTPDPAITPEPTVIETPLPTGICKVPNFRNKSTSVAMELWVDAGFAAGNILFSPLVPPHYTIRNQSLAQNSNHSCASSITVSGRT